MTNNKVLLPILGFYEKLNNFLDTTQWDYRKHILCQSLPPNYIVTFKGNWCSLRNEKMFKLKSLNMIEIVISFYYISIQLIVQTKICVKDRFIQVSYLSRYGQKHRLMQPNVNPTLHIVLGNIAWDPNRYDRGKETKCQ